MITLSDSKRPASSRFSPLHVRPDMPSAWLDADMDFDTAAERIISAHQADGLAKDQPVLDLQTWALTAHADHFALQPVAGHLPARKLRSSAFSHLMGRLGAPVEFIRDRLPAPLQLATVNYLLTQLGGPKSASLRLRGDEVAAIVSERYCALDPQELLSTVRDVLAQQGMLDAVRARSIATGPVDVLRLVLPSETRAVKVGDISAVGLDISTSSFSKAALRVTGVIWRLRCTNGLRVAERGGELSFRHIGEVQRMKDGLAEAIPSCVARARGVMDAWERAVHVMIDSVTDFVDSLRLSIAERALLEEELVAEAGVPELPEAASVYDVGNAITATARRAEPVRRLELEDIAGHLVVARAGRP
jgi:hypothetical protein